MANHTLIFNDRVVTHFFCTKSWSILKNNPYNHKQSKSNPMKNNKSKSIEKDNQTIVPEVTMESIDSNNTQMTENQTESSTEVEPVPVLHINTTRFVERVELIPLHCVQPHPELVEFYKEKNLRGLMLTMNLAGRLLEPLKVVRREGELFIVDGISRYKAAKELQWKFIDVDVYDYTDEEVLNQYVTINIKTKRSMAELCQHAEQILTILGSSQGKKRETIGEIELPNEEFGIVGKDRFEIACEVIGSDISASSLRRLLAVKDFEENGDDEVKGMGLLKKLDSGDMKINNAFNAMENYQKAKKENGRNELIETLKIIKEGGYELHNSTCEDLSDIPDDSVDCCVGSSPYYQQRIYREGDGEAASTKLGLENTVDEFVKKQVDIYRGVYPKLKDTGSLFIVIADSFDKGEDCLVIEKLSIEMKAAGWHRVQKWYWRKESQKPQSNIKRLMPTYEMVLHYVKDKDKYFFREFKNWKEGGFTVARGTKDVGMGKKRSRTTWTIVKPVERFRNFLDEQKVKDVLHANGFNWQELAEVDPDFRHAAPYPSYIPLLPILMTTKIGWTVLDIYNGTGTTSAVARQLGRKAIGYDTDTDSHKFAAKRLRMTEDNLPTEDEVRGLEYEYLDDAA